MPTEPELEPEPRPHGFAQWSNDELRQFADEHQLPYALLDSLRFVERYSVPGPRLREMLQLRGHKHEGER